MSKRPVRIGCREIQEVVAGHYGIELHAMMSDRRSHDLSHPRQLSMWIATQLTPRSMMRIGDLFNRDHTTVMHATRVIPDRLRRDPDLRRECLAVLRRLELLKRSNVVPFPGHGIKPEPAQIETAMDAVAAELVRDPAGTLSRLARRFCDADVRAAD